MKSKEELTRIRKKALRVLYKDGKIKRQQIPMKRNISYLWKIK